MANQPISPAAEMFGRHRVRTRRHQLGLSQEQLADECGLHRTYVGQVERGRRNISLQRIDPGELVQGLRAPEG
jgi:transcriptional regulator with XRE-family HTH domain